MELVWDRLADSDRESAGLLGLLLGHGDRQHLVGVAGLGLVGVHRVGQSQRPVETTGASLAQSEWVESLHCHLYYLHVYYLPSGLWLSGHSAVA